MTTDTPTPAPMAPLPSSSRLTVQRFRRPLVDPVQILAVIPSSTWHGLFCAPDGERLLGVGVAGRLALDPAGRSNNLSISELAMMLLVALVQDGDTEDLEPLRALFFCAFDPHQPFGPIPDRDLWRGFGAVEIAVPEILLRFEDDEIEVVLLATESRLETLADQVNGWLESTGTTEKTKSEESTDRRGGRLRVEWDRDAHRANVEAALALLEETTSEGDDPMLKVVLAHRVHVEADDEIEAAAVLARLETTFPDCFLFSLRSEARDGRDGPVFLGASPERLAKVAEGRLSTGALAGSARRGATEEEDERLAEELLASTKDREEHRIVRDMIVEALGSLSDEVEAGDEPSVAKFDNVQHLFTPISGQLHFGSTIVDAVAALHPTPAVGGMPRAQALETIRRLEAQPRGLYAGVVGWADLVGNGDLAVMIRSALIDGPEAWLFAGGGIVPTSDPDAEVEEAGIKLAAILDALGGSVTEENAADPGSTP